MPPSMHLVIATRADPPLPLARLRGRGTMLEIGADDLRFTVDEAADLLRELRGADLSPDDVKALTLRTEGWAVGLKMAALSMGQERGSLGVHSRLHRQSALCHGLPHRGGAAAATREVQDFLLKTSVLERLTAPLCDAVTGRADSQDLLPDLERANLFVVPLDEPREWYRYEHLFAELLRHQLDMVSGKKVVADLHQRASHWYQRGGFLIRRHKPLAGRPRLGKGYGSPFRR